MQEKSSESNSAPSPTTESIYEQETRIVNNPADNPTVVDSNSAWLVSSVRDQSTGSITNQGNETVATDVELVIGSIIKNTYELVATLGEGGMGTVFKAKNLDWEAVEARDPYVAIKVLKPELSSNKQLVRSLFSDFDRSKMLANCPNIIKVYDFSRAGSHVYMTMECLDGQSLAEYIDGQAIKFTQAWAIIEGIGNALDYAHRHNIVHRDIKPGNIMITNDALVKVLDFGIASKINESEDDKTKFSGHDLGALTMAYASPEMQKDYPPDARDDIYAFACVIYEILTGKKFYNQRIQKAAPIPGLNSKQMDALNKALAFERNQRTNNIRELLDKLRPAKTPWVTYLSIAGGITVIVAGGLWKLNSPTTPTIEETAAVPVATEPLKPTEALPAPVIAEPPKPIVTAEPVPAPIASEPVTTEPVRVPLITEPPKTAELPQAPVITEPAKTVVTAEPVPAPVATAPPKPPTELSHQATSSDGILHIQTSKAVYKIKDELQLSVKLRKKRYVRTLIHDAKGQDNVMFDRLLTTKERPFTGPVEGPAGKEIFTIIASETPLPENIKIFNQDGSLSEEIKNSGYSWAQIQYTIQ